MSAELMAMAAIVLGAWASEDLAAIGAGVLVAEGGVGWVGGVLAAAVGIWVGDIGLWAVGRAAGPALSTRWATRLVRPEAVASARSRYERHAGKALFATRFMPGTRAAMYVSAGALGLDLKRFAAWTAVAVVIWVPLIVGGVVLVGAPAVSEAREFLNMSWGGLLVVAAVGMLIWQGRAVVRALSGAARRVRHWEFWPAWLFYAPVVPWVGALILRYGGRAIAAANPGFEDGGFVGESKTEILRKLPAEWVIPFLPVRPGSAETRLAALDEAMVERGWTYPIVLKPDAGQRGMGVRLVRDREAAGKYFTDHTVPVMAQQYHAGPYEAGIFYYRMPGAVRGRIFSITDKRFPVLTGDGETSLGDLIRQHPRFRLQARVFLSRHRACLDSVPAAGRSVRLAVAGNHAQGTMFVDGSSLETPELVARIDEIARAIPGFFVGRFDVRYSDPRGLMAGTDLAIIELNGVTSEATHIYDPSLSLWTAYRTLFRQWHLVFQIGVANLRAGCEASSLSRLLRLSFAHVTARGPALPAD